MDRSTQARRAAAETRRRLLLDAEKSLLERLNDTRAGLAACDREIALCDEAERAVRTWRVTQEDLRATVRRLGAFTVSELAAELRVSTAVARRHLRTIEEFGMARPAGRAMGQKFYEYVKPTDAGAAFEAQKRLRVVPDDDIAPVLAAKRGAPVAGTGSNPWDAIPSKLVREAVRDAVREGWKLRRKGDGHWSLLRGPGEEVGVAGTPKNPGGTAELIRRETGIKKVS